MLTKPQAFYDNIYKQALGYQNPFYLKKAQRIKPTLYDGTIISNKHVAIPVIDDEETMILEELSRLKMSRNEKDIEDIKQKISNKPIDYAKLNKLYKDFEKCFVPQQELSVDEAYWKKIVDIAAQKPSANTIVPVMFKLDLVPLAPKLLQNREAHIDYLKYTQEQADILYKIVKQAKAKQPLDNALDFAWNRSQLMNFVSKFLGTTRFENDHIARIMRDKGYSDEENPFDAQQILVETEACIFWTGRGGTLMVYSARSESVKVSSTRSSTSGLMD
nr:hypothetical protein [Tanacetum cinerariifolium]